MRIICVEEHLIDPATAQTAQPALMAEARYAGLMDSANV